MTDNPDARPQGFGEGLDGQLDETTPVIAGVVIETRPGSAKEVAIRLEEIDGLDIAGTDGDRRLAGVWSAPSPRALEDAVEELIRQDDDLLGIFPTFVGRADDEQGPAHDPGHPFAGGPEPDAEP